MKLFSVILLMCLTFYVFGVSKFEAKESQMEEPTTITLEQLDRLGVDKKGKLYWDNKPVMTEEKVRLSGWVNAAIIIGSLSTLGLFVLGLLNFFIKKP